MTNIEQLAIRHLSNWGADTRHASMLAAFANELLRAPASAPECSSVTDDMVERAWAAIVGTDVAPMCFQASIIRADLRTALEAVLSVAQLPAWETIRDILTKHRMGGNDPQAYCPGEKIEQVAREIASTKRNTP